MSASRNVGELLPAAVEAVLVALRLGLCVLRVRELVDSEASASSWSVLVSGLGEESASSLIEEYSIKTVRLAALNVIKVLTIAGDPPVVKALHQRSGLQWSHDQRATTCP